MLSGHFPGYSEAFQIIRKPPRPYGHFPDYPKTFQIIRNFPDHPETFQTTRKRSSAISRVTRKNFPDAQKHSGWQCHDATMVFMPLLSQLDMTHLQMLFFTWNYPGCAIAKKAIDLDQLVTLLRPAYLTVSKGFQFFFEMTCRGMIYDIQKDS